MSLKKIFPILIILFSFVLAIYFYPHAPLIMVTHWGLYGDANGYSSRFFALFFMPILSVFLYIIFRLLPLTDPYHSHFKEFEKYFDTFINILFVFLFYSYFLTLIWNLVSIFNLIQFLSPGFALLFYYAGVLCSVAKRNWFVGIRTPWTLSSDDVWQKTHQLGATLFKLIALLSLSGIIWPKLAFFFILIPIISVSLFLFFYSFYLFKKSKF